MDEESDWHILSGLKKDLLDAYPSSINRNVLFNPIIILRYDVMSSDIEIETSTSKILYKFVPD
jgi:hypothetical protein